MTEQISMLPADRLQLNRIVRSDVEKKTYAQDITRLAKSITSRGVMTPLIVCPAEEDDRYSIIDGNRRYEAGLEAGLEQFPCIIRGDFQATSADRVTMVGFSTNEMRSDLKPSQQTAALLRVLEHGDISLEEVARATGKSKDQLRNILQRSKLDPGVVRMVDRGEIAPSASERLAPLEKKEQREVVRTLKALDIPISDEAIRIYRGQQDLDSRRISRRVKKKLVENIGLQAAETKDLQTEYRNLEREINKALARARAIMDKPNLADYIRKHYPEIHADFQEVLESL